MPKCWQIDLNCKKATQNASKLTILRSEIEKFSGEGALPPLQTPSPVGRGNPLPTSHPSRRLDFDAFGVRPQRLDQWSPQCWIEIDAHIKSSAGCSHQMPDFWGKMHQIQFRLRLRPRLHMGIESSSWLGGGHAVAPSPRTDTRSLSALWASIQLFPQTPPS